MLAFLKHAIDRHKQLSVLFMLTFLWVLASSLAWAEDDPEDDDDDFDDYVYHDSSASFINRDEVAIRLEPLGFGLMGDSIDPFTGTVMFSHTDVSLPGSFDLEVAIRRTISTATMTHTQEGFFGDWVLDIPNISSLSPTYSSNGYFSCVDHEPEDTISAYPKHRFDDDGNFDPSLPHGSSPSDIEVSKGSVWQGMTLNIPGQGGKFLIEGYHDSFLGKFSFDREFWKPFEPRPYDHTTDTTTENGISRVTTDHWVVTCISPSSGGSFQGYTAIAPDGRRYRMDKKIVRKANDFEIYQNKFFYLPRNIGRYYATEVTDVHGNWVKYDFSSDDKLTRIHSSDGRSITLTYVPGTQRIATVTANGRTWTYTYRELDQPSDIAENATINALYRVKQPDNHYWEFDLEYFRLTEPASFNYRSSDGSPDPNVTTYVKHPYGMRADYEVGIVRHGGDTVQSGSLPGAATWTYNRAVSVFSKTLSGPSVPTSTWTYDYEQFYSNTPFSGDTTKTTTVTDPVGRKTVSHFIRANGYHGSPLYSIAYSGSSLDSTIEFEETQTTCGLTSCSDKGLGAEALKGKVVKEERFAADGTLLETVDTSYRVGEKMGRNEAFTNISVGRNFRYVYPTKTVTRRDGDTYTKELTYNTNMDSSSYSYGKPISVTSYSNISTTPRETVIDYTHKKDQWILSLTAKETTNGRVMIESGYDSDGKKLWVDEYGHRVATFGYHTSTGYKGALYSIKDAEDRLTYYLYYYRGMPRAIKRPDNRQDYVGVDSNGWVTSKKDYRGYTTTYSRDSMGRVTKITPSKTQKSWLDTNITYSFGNEVTQTITRGNKREVITYDNFLRSIKEEIRDLSTNESTYTGTEYYADGNTRLRTWPSASASSEDGDFFVYDGLGRKKYHVETVSPYATTSYNYLSGHARQVIDPENHTTTRYYDGYSGPGKGALRHISQPLGVNTQLYRNVWGQLTRMRQYGTHNGTYKDESQYFYYNDRQRLCRHRTDEGGDTLYAYDDSGYRTSYAKGMSSGSSCSAPSGSSLVTLTLDPVGQVTHTNFASSSTPDISKTYDGNGNVLTVNRGGVNWTYVYDELNQLTSEKLDIDGRHYDQSYTYNTNAFLTRHVLPSGRAIDYTHDGLGRHTSVSSYGFEYLRDVIYHPNSQIERAYYGHGGGIQQFLNERQLVERSRAWGPIDDWMVLDYEYDARGNIVEQDDDVSRYDFSYSYDALGRLSTANSSALVWGDASYEYDVLGNLIEKNIGSRSVKNTYDSRNRVTSTNDSANGNRSLSYDSRGNVTKLGGLNFIYDYADQPVTVSGSTSGSYTYDGNLRRVKAVVGGKTLYNIYSQSGKLVHVHDVTNNKVTDYVRGANRTVARITNGVTTYVHSDHLGSGLLGTDEDGEVAWRHVYTPFGEKFIANSANDDLAGFTGHIEDSATGLTYMQARYYDPAMGRFLSIDPVDFVEHLRRGNSAAHAANRYAYANNNPNKYVDPDGEFGVAGAVYGAIAGGVGGFVAGGDFKSTLVGAVAGGAVGFVNPLASNATGLAVGGGVASIVGQSAPQIVGNIEANGVSVDAVKNVSINKTAVAGAMVGGMIGGAASKTIAPTVATPPVLGNSLSGTTSSTTGKVIGAAVEGAIAGAVEALGAKMENDFDQAMEN